MRGVSRKREVFNETRDNGSEWFSPPSTSATVPLDFPAICSASSTFPRRLVVVAIPSAVAFYR
jgi:hypothetical protein